MNENWVAKLNQYIQKGLIRVARHPSLPLNIYNYTQKATFEEYWDDITMTCRGLVLDDTNQIIIKPPRKFFNYDQIYAPDITYWSNECIYEKLDGYYISIKNDTKYGLIITSRGSFDNKYVDAAKALIEPVKSQLIPNITYFCELLQTFPGDESIIVAQYDTPSLKCWAMRTPDFEEIPLSVSCPFETARLIKPEKMREFMSKEVEGVVIFNPSTSERVKVKTGWFLARHRLISNCTPKRVWEILSQGELVENLDVPDEFLPTLKEMQQDFQDRFEAERARLEDLADEYDSLTDKELGLKDLPSFDKAAIFSIRKDNYSSLYERIWKKLKPKAEN